MACRARWGLKDAGYSDEWAGLLLAKWPVVPVGV